MSEIRTNIVNSEDGTAAVQFPKGQVVTGIVTATSFTGNITGNVTGTVSGNAGTATVLENARTIGGVSFNGSANINLPGVNAAGNQNTTGLSAGLSGTPQLNVGVTTATNIKITGTSESTIHTQAASAGGNTSPAYQTADNFIITMGGNTTMTANNQKIGQTGAIFIVQDGTGSRPAAWHADYKWAGGTAPTLSTAANSIDRIDYFVKASNQIHAVASLDVK